MKKPILHVQVDAGLKAEAEALASRLGIPLTIVVTAVLRKFIADKGVEIREYAFDSKGDSPSLYDNDEFRVPSADQYSLAIRSLVGSGALKTWMVNMLVAQYHAPSHKISSIELAKKLKYNGFVAVNRWYGEIGKLIAKKIVVSYGALIPAVVVSTFVKEKVAGSKTPQWTLTMRPEVAEALKELKII